MDHEFAYERHWSDDGKPGLDKPRGNYLPALPLLPRWCHRLLTLVLVGLYVHTAYQTGLITPTPPRTYAHTNEQGRKLVGAIVDRAQRDPHYTTEKCAADTKQIVTLEKDTDWVGPTPVVQGVIGVIRNHAVDQLMVQTVLPRWKGKGAPDTDTHNYLRMQAMNEVCASFESGEHRHISPKEWHKIRLTIGGLWLLGLPFAAVMLLGRILVASRTLKEAYGMAWGAGRIQLGAAWLFWPIGLIGYHPDDDLLYEAINRLANRRGSHARWSPVWETGNRPTCPIWLTVEAEVLTCPVPRLELIRAVWSRPQNPATPVLSLSQRPWQFVRHLSHASYATAMLCVILPLGRIAAADGSVIVTDTLDDKKKPAVTLNIGDPKIGRAWVYNADTRAPIFEGSLVAGQAHVGKLRTNLGPYFRLGLRDYSLQHAGVCGFYTVPVAGGVLAGPWYLGFTPYQGGEVFSAPNSRLLWKASADGTVKVGLGFAVTATHGSPPDFQFGPDVQFKLNHDGAIARVRLSDDPRHFDGRKTRLLFELCSPF